LSRVFKTSWDPNQGQVARSYLHNSSEAGVGKIGSLFVLESGTGDASKNDDISEIAYTLAMHSAAMKPSFLTRDHVPSEALD